MSAPPPEAEAFQERVEVARSELKEIEETEIDDGEAARRIELQLDALASALFEMIKADKLPAEASSSAVEDDVFGWLISQKLLPADVSKQVEQITELAASARYGEEPDEDEVTKAEEARQELLPLFQRLLDTW